MSEAEAVGAPSPRGESPPVTFHHGEGPEILEQVLPLRRVVFVDEQGGPPEDEPDEHDAGAVHLLLRKAERVVATARLVRTGPEALRLGRVCVCRDLRGAGLGRLLVGEAERVARSIGGKLVKLSAQEEAVAFYERLGYCRCGEPFVEAGIPHRWMMRTLNRVDGGGNGLEPG